MGAIYLIRHGQASFGQADYDRLSPVGHQQSAVLGRALKQLGISPSQVVRGNMRRHAQTAESCMAELAPQHDARIDPGYNEYDADDVLAKYRADFATPEGIAQEMARSSNPRAHFQTLFAEAVGRWVGGAHDAEYKETWPSFKLRCIAALDRVIASGGSGHTSLIFTSGGAISTLVGHTLGLDDRAMFRLNWIIANTSITRIIYGNGRLSLSYFNNYRHVEADETLLTYR